MKKYVLIIYLLIFGLTGYSQAKKISGSWIFRDSISTIQLFIKTNGIIEERSGNASENIWDKTPRTGTYSFSDTGKLIITWADKSEESRNVKFKDNFNAAEILFKGLHDKSKRTYLFLRIVDEEVIIDN